MLIDFLLYLLKTTLYELNFIWLVQDRYVDNANFIVDILYNIDISGINKGMDISLIVNSRKVELLIHH